jgi:Rieske Fe-S protein
LQRAPGPYPSRGKSGEAECTGDCPGCARATAASSGQQSARETAKRRFRLLQKATGVMLLLSTAAGVYLLSTDASLRLLAVSHAVGLVIIVCLDFTLGLYSLASSRSVYLPSIAAGVLGFVLQAGDVLTAPQYNMTIPYFAHYLFGLGAFDALLALQAGVVVAGVLGRPHARYLSRRRTRSAQELNYTRRGFLKALIGFAGLVGAGVLLGSIKLPKPSSTVQSTTSGTVQGSVANVNSLKVATPVYFEYPSGYPNALIKNSDGSLTALSMLCTHVCCQCSFDPASAIFYCPCHGSIFDISGKVVRGPAVADLPTITLRVDSSGNVYPTGVSNPGPCHA